MEPLDVCPCDSRCLQKMNKRSFRTMGLDDEPTMEPSLVYAAVLNLNPQTHQELTEAVKLIKERSKIDRDWVMEDVPSVPQLPANIISGQNLNKDLRGKIRSVSNYLRSFEYNHIGRDFFQVDKKKPLNNLMDVAKQIMRENLPMKCLEAVCCAQYLTRDWPIMRFPLRFQTTVDNHVFWHVVMGIQLQNGKFGALGISRRPTLDYRDVTFDSLSALTLSYIKEYSIVGHTVNKVTVGLPFGNKEFSTETVYWHFFLLRISSSTSWRKFSAVLDMYMAYVPKLDEELRRTGNISVRHMKAIFRPIPVEFRPLPLKSPEHHCFRFSTRKKIKNAAVETKVMLTPSGEVKTGESMASDHDPSNPLSGKHRRPPSSRRRDNTEAARSLLGV